MRSMVVAVKSCSVAGWSTEEWETVDGRDGARKKEGHW